MAKDDYHVIAAKILVYLYKKYKQNRFGNYLYKTSHSKGWLFLYAKGVDAY